MKKFQRKVENFTCERCNSEVIGDGYTNHCPKCLWSKHVDINPGDRRATCEGLMEPVEIKSEGNGNVVVHKCITCGHVRPNKVDASDSFDALIEISEEVSHG